MFDKKDYKDGEFCPFVMGKCVRHQCALFTKVVGTDPQTNTPVEKFGCALSWLPILMVENSNMQRHTSASVDKVATEVAKFHATSIGCMNETARDNLIAANPRLLPSLPQGEPNGNTNGKS